jgi:hypothetical protein
MQNRDRTIRKLSNSWWKFSQCRRRQCNWQQVRDDIKTRFDS